MVWRTEKTMGIGLCTRTGMSTKSDERQLRHQHGFLHCLTTHLSLHNDRHIHNLAKNWTCGASTGL